MTKDAPNIDDGRTVAAMDVLAPGIGEIIGGSQREERPDILDQSMAERSIDKEHYAWYRDLRRYGTVPYAGFGLGFEHTLATSLASRMCATPFPSRAPRETQGIEASRLGACAATRGHRLAAQLTHNDRLVRSNRLRAVAATEVIAAAAHRAVAPSPACCVYLGPRPPFLKARCRRPSFLFTGFMRSRSRTAVLLRRTASEARGGD
jgi:hypothetical protein